MINTIIRFSLSATLLIFAVGCSTSVDKLRTSKQNGTEFQKILSEKYLEFAESEADQYDWCDSEYFAKKGMKLATGIDVSPEELTNRKLPKDTIPTLVQARSYLMKVLDADLKKKFPEKAASIQLFFDCWVEQQEENWQNDHIDDCREKFYSTLDEIYVLTSPISAEEKATLRGEVIEAFNGKSGNIYFAFGKSDIDKKGKDVIKKIAKTLKGKSNYTIVLNAYTDKIGNANFNLHLSRKRAQVVKNMLVKNGVKKNKITVFAFGEERSDIEPKSTKNKKNRVVEIIVNQ